MSINEDFVFGHSIILEYSGVADAYADAGAEDWIKLARLTSMDPPPLDADETETSHMESEDQWKEYASGWADVGEMSVTIQYSADRRAEVMGLFRVMKGWRITYLDGSTMEMNGFIKSLPHEINREGIIEQTVTIRGSGKPTFTVAVPAGT